MARAASQVEARRVINRGRSCSVHHADGITATKAGEFCRLGDFESISPKILGSLRAEKNVIHYPNAPTVDKYHTTCTID